MCFVEERTATKAGGGFLVVAAAVGLTTGCLVAALKRSVAETSLLLSLAPGGSEGWALPVVGGAAVATTRLVVGAGLDVGLGKTIDDAMRGRPLDVVSAGARAAAAVATLGSGCSLGPEGPAVDLGSTASRAAGLFAGKRLPMDADELRALVCIGTAAGVAAGFNAPISGSLFAWEVAAGLRPPAGSGSPRWRFLAPTFVAVAVSAFVSRQLLSQQLSFAPDFGFGGTPGDSALQLPEYLALGVVCGLGAAVFRGMRGLARSASASAALAGVPQEYQPLLGSAVCAAIACAQPGVLFSSYETLDALVNSWDRLAPAQDLVVLFVAKTVATATCAEFGLVGGLFAPSLFLGAALGSAVARVPAVAAWAVMDPHAVPLVAAASVLAAVYRAPLTSTFLLLELTRDSYLAPPLLVATGMATVVAELIAPEDRGNVSSTTASSSAARQSSRHRQ